MTNFSFPLSFSLLGGGGGATGTIAAQDADDVTITGGVATGLEAYNLEPSTTQYFMRLPSFTTTGIRANDSANSFSLRHQGQNYLDIAIGQVTHNFGENNVNWVAKSEDGTDVLTINASADSGSGSVIFGNILSTDNVQATGSGGVIFRTNGGTTSASFGGGGSTAWTFAGNVFIDGATDAKSQTVAVSGTTKTLALTDANSFQECSNGSAQTITIPTNASVAFPTGTWLTFEQHGAGVVTIEGDTGVSVNGSSGGSVAISAQWGAITIRKIGTDSWIAYGSVA